MFDRNTQDKPMTTISFVYTVVTDLLPALVALVIFGFFVRKRKQRRTGGDNGLESD